MIKTEILKSFKINGERFEYDFSMINQLAKHTRNVGLVEIEYNNRSFKEGKKNTWTRSEKDVCWFDVAVDDRRRLELVQILEPSNHVRSNFQQLLGNNLFISFVNEVFQRATTHELHKNCDLRRDVPARSHELYDVRVGDAGENLDFCAETLQT